MTSITCVCLAAGRSSRMKGEHKLLKEIDGETVIARVAAQIASVPCDDRLYILGAEAEKIGAQIAPYSSRTAFNSDYAKGMHSSIRTAIMQLKPATDAVVICLGDQPFDLKKRILNLLKDRVIHSTTLVRSIVKGLPGHPVLIGSSFFATILEGGDGDHGCSYLFKENPFDTVEQPESALWDLDTPEDFARHHQS